MIDLAVVALYLVSLIAIGWIAKQQVSNEQDFAVAGRRLGPLMYGGTMAAVVLGGASTIGGVGLGYRYGVSGMWLVFAIGCGVVVVSLLFAGRIRRMKVFTVGEMLDLRYGRAARLMTGVVMCAYTLLICVVSTIACGSVLSAMLGVSKYAAMALGGGVVLVYSVMGGMWSVTLTDIVQFVIKTVGIFLILVPVALWRAGGLDGLSATLPASAFSPTFIGRDTIVAYFVTYVLGLVIGQDIWQRIATARTEGVARWAGLASGVYCLAYAAAGAVIGMCAKALLPALSSADQAFPKIVALVLPPGLSGLVVAAALAAIMSTSSGALIAAATVAKKDVVDVLPRLLGARAVEVVKADEEAEDLASSRFYLIALGLAAIVLGWVMKDIIAALTIAYAILVGGLLVAIVGGIVWRRGNLPGALASMVVGVVVTIAVMIVGGDIYASAPLLIGVAASLAAFVIVSLLFPAATPQALAAWDRRLAAPHADQKTGEP